MTGVEKNNREKEQGVTAKPPATVTQTPAEPQSPQPHTTIAAPVKPVKEPFRMEIVEAQGVREVLFDGDTGRVIQPSGDKNTPAGPTLPTSAKPAGEHAAGAASDAAKMLEDFPIKFDSDKI
jgi:hypothetical protein